MKLWSIAYDEELKNINFPQVVYKSFSIPIELETKLVNRIFQIFYLTHQDARREIEAIAKNKTELPYRKLYNLIFHKTENYEFETEYLVALLNFFNIELNDEGNFEIIIG